MLENYGRYRTIRLLGQGGMANVYLAEDTAMGRQVAIKVLPHGVDEDAFSRFQIEIQTVANLHHQAILPIYDVGEEEGRPFYVMPHMQGGTLSERLGAGPLKAEIALKLVKRLAGALDTAHRVGIIHRDLKPGNVLIDGDDEIYLADFGIAKLQEAHISVTRSEQTPGTPAYMSPEHMGGAQDLDGRADIYALGVMLFEMLAGKLPYEGTNPIMVALQHLQDPIPNLMDVRSDLPPGCDLVIQKAMAKDRDERFQTVAELAEALEMALTPGKMGALQSLISGKTANNTPLPPPDLGLPPRIMGYLPQSVVTTTIMVQRQIRRIPMWARWSIALLVVIGSFSLVTTISSGDEPATPAPTQVLPPATPTALPTVTVTLTSIPTPVVFTETLLIVESGSGAIVEVGGDIERIPEDGRVRLTTTSSGVSLQTDMASMEAVLPDLTKLYLTGNSLLDVLSVVGMDESRETAVQLQSGQIAVESRSERAIVFGPDEQEVHIWEGGIGVEVLSDGSGTIRVDCLQGRCLYRAADNSFITIPVGAAHLLDADGNVSDPMPAYLEAYALIFPGGPTPTVTPTNTPTPIPTETPTPHFTSTPTRVLPTPEPFIIGRSVEQQPIEAIRFGNGENVFVFIGGLQGGFSPNSLALAQEMVAYFSENLEAVPEDVTLYIIPNMNPDAPDRPSNINGRYNANGVDLNRNWDCRWIADPLVGGQTRVGAGGTAPYSEPESQAVAQFISANSPVAVIFWIANFGEAIISPGSCIEQTLVSIPVGEVYGEAAGYEFYSGSVFADPNLNGDVSNSLDVQGVPAISILLSGYEEIDWENNLAGTLAVLNEYKGPPSTFIYPPPTSTTLTPPTPPCQTDVASRWMGDLYPQFAIQLGCPVTGETFPKAVYQLYQEGMMVWRGDTDEIYVLFYNGSYGRYVADAAGAGFQEDDLHRGAIGYLWWTNESVQRNLGEPMAPEVGIGEFVVQRFQTGTIFYFEENFEQTYLLFDNGLSWEAIQEK